MDGLTTLVAAPDLGEQVRAAYARGRFAFNRALRHEGLDPNDGGNLFVVFSADNPHAVEVDRLLAAFQALNARWAAGER